MTCKAMHSNFNDLKTKTMEYKDLVKHHTQLIKDKNDNKWEVIETSDLEEICEAYHQSKLKLLGIGDIILSLPSREEIDEQIDKYAFRAPYDGSNNFYDEVALKHYKAGIEWLLSGIQGNGG